MTNEIALLENEKIENLIYEIRGQMVMLDSDVARLFGYETKYLNRQVRRNIKRFPENYCFNLTEDEYHFLRCQNGTIKNDRGQYSKYLPYVYTEYGITMLAGLLKSDVAVKMSLKIVDTFILMKKYMVPNLISQKYYNDMTIRHDSEIKLLQESFEKIKNKEENIITYYNGEIFDAYSKIVEIFKEAKDELIIIDRYADKILLDMIKRLKVNITLITKKNSLLSNLDIDKYNKQYHNLKIIYSNTYHDRYFIIDKKEIYHCGASINHAGSKTFSINKWNDELVIKSFIDKLDDIIKKIQNNVILK